MFSKEHPETFLKKFWGYDEFRSLQKDIILSVLKQKDTLALLPTGGGKSVCYQVPASMMEGCCIVVSPLISLMLDQVNDLNKRGIKAIAITSFMKYHEIDRALDNVVYGDYKLLYVSPERIQTEMFLRRFEKMKVSFIAVDEAHCISQWGYDFRPSYLEIQKLREIKKTTFLALTATATDRVLKDITESLNLKSPELFKKSFKRDNIKFNVEKSKNKTGRMVEMLESTKGSGIIYTRNRKRCRELAEMLSNNGLKASYYHAGLDQKQRAERQANWTQKSNQVMVATNAFGMGIDKPDVRFVMHYELPDSLESFYQEAGRAGRDGKESTATLMYGENDVLKLQKDFKQLYPSDQEIRQIYQKLCNHFQLAVGSGKDELFPFDLKLFSSKNKIDKRLVFNTLKLLDSEGVIGLSEGIKEPSQIHIKPNLHPLRKFQDDNKSYDVLIQYLLRAYSGIVEQFVRIDENEISKKTGLKTDEVFQKLDYLASIQLIEYKKQTELPIIAFLVDRPSAAQLVLSASNLRMKRERHSHRMEAMINYATAESGCRMNLILEYFGEKPSEPCGNCDLCVKPKTKLNTIELKDFEKRIRNVLKHESQINLQQLAEVFPEFQQSLIIDACRRLCEEDVLKLKKGNAFALN